MIFASINKNELYRQAIHFRLSACVIIIPHPSFLSISSSHFYHIYKFLSFQSCIFHKFTEPSQAKALPLGELAGASPTERARLLTENHRRCDSIALTKSLPIAAQRLFPAGLVLSVIASQCHLSQRERLWQAARRKKPPFGDCSSGRGSFLLGEPMDSFASTFITFIICHSPQKSSTTQKVYSHSSLGISCIFLAKRVV